MKHPRFC